MVKINGNGPVINGMKQQVYLSKGQELKMANKQIALMVEHQEKGMEQIRNQAWRIIQLQMAVTALCLEFNVSTEKCKEIYDAFCAKEDEKIIAAQQAELDKAKAKLVADIKAGKKVEFTAMDRDLPPKQ